MDIVVRHIKEIAATFECPFLVENIAYLFCVPPSTMTEAEFITRVIRESGCWLLLDLANLMNNATNHNYDPYEFLDQIPLDRVVQIHPVIESGLLEEQAQRLLGIDTERLEIFAEMVLSQRIADITQILPATAGLLGPRLRPLAVEVNHKLAPEYSKKHDLALAFAGFLQSQFQSQPPTPPFLEDVLSYEMVLAEIYSDGFDSESVHHPGLAEHLREPAMWPEIVLLKASNTRILSVNYDAPTIVEAIKNGQIPERAEPQPMDILVRLNSVGIFEQDRINAPTRAFIEACDGRPSLDEIIRSLAGRFQQDGPALFPQFLNRCLALCESLVERDVIRLTIAELPT